MARLAELTPHASIEPAVRALIGTASGFYVTTDGLVLTNAHVVSLCNSWEVNQNSELSPATLVAVYLRNDLALLRTVADSGEAGPPFRADAESAFRPCRATG
jgi:S1-C subfamily serine protease